MARATGWILTGALLLLGCAPGTRTAPDPATPAPEEEVAEAPEEVRQEEDPTLPPHLRAGARVEDIQVNPSPLEVTVGESLDLTEFEFTPVDADGEPVEGIPVIKFLQDRIAIVENDGLRGLQEGTAEMIVAVMAPPEDGVGGPEPRIFTTPVVVRGKPVAEVEVAEPGHAFYVGTSVPLEARAFTADGDRRRAVEVEWRSADPEIASVGTAGHVRAQRPGRTTVTASAEGVEGRIAVEVRENPVRSIDLRPALGTVRTGDVFRFRAIPRDGNGEPVDDIALTFSVSGDVPYDAVGGAVYSDGSFVAERPGTYRVVASAGRTSGEAVVDARAREVKQEVREVGQGLVADHPTSDLWVFEGVDGRDYAYIGTHAGGQKMYAWDVTDPASPVLTDSVVVDARVVNDVKVNEDATLAVITREGASDRRNGIVVLDLSTPAHPRVLAEYTETLTGGVHNTFIVDDLVYAIHNGTLDVHILDLSDPERPREVGRWGIDRSGKYLHDIWVVDGLAYVSYWDDGVWILDVGDGRWGGTPTEPVPVSSYAYADREGDWGNTHVAFPYTNSDGRSYLFVGDEVFGCEECVSRAGPHEDGPRGYIHIFDLSDPENLVEVGRYEVPEAGAHNVWAEDDKLYVAYYQAGLRVVDISGELRGDLYRQGREIAWFPTGHPEGHSPNSPMAWGPQPYKGQLFVSDLNSGLWVLRLEPPEGDPVIP